MSEECPHPYDSVHPVSNGSVCTRCGDYWPRGEGPLGKNNAVVALSRIENCKRCGGLGWLDDPTACGDPEHCSPVYPCSCNPEGLD